MDWIMTPKPPNSYIEAPTLDVIMFGERAFREVIKVKQGHKGETLIQYNWYPYRKKRP